MGSGFGGAYYALSLQKQSKRVNAEVVLIDRNNYFVFYPLLIEAGIGNLEPRHAVVSIREFLRSPDFRMAEVADIDTDAQKIEYRPLGTSNSTSLFYDHLVLAVGSITNLPDVAGLKQYGYQLKSILDAVKIRDRAIEMLESADAVSDVSDRKSMLSFVVVGGNFTGVEIAGQLDDLLRQR